MGEFASLPQPQAQDAFVASPARPPAAPRATAAPPVPAVGQGDGAAAGKLFAGMYDAPAAEADADQRVGALLGARGLVGKKAMLLDLLRGTRDAATLRTAFEARTGQPLDEWLDKELGHAATPEKPNADRNEADAILSGDKKSAIAAALANVPKRGGKKKILAVLASAGGDPELIAAARAAWFMQHGTQLDEELTVDESAALVEGDQAKAQSFKALDAGEDDDPKEMLAIFRGAKDTKERERRLCACMQTDDPKMALALLQGQYGGKGADGDLLVAVAGGDEIGAAAANVELARGAKDLDKLNESMTAAKNPNEPGIDEAEKKKRLELHKAKMQAVEAAWAAKYGDPESKESAGEQFSTMLDDTVDAGAKWKPWKRKYAAAEKERLHRTEAAGGLSRNEEGEYVRDLGDPRKVKKFQANKSGHELFEVDEHLRQTGNEEDLGSIIGKTTGRTHDELENDSIYGGKPATQTDAAAKERQAHENQLGPGNGPLGRLVSDADERMGRSMGEIDRLEARVRSGDASDDERRQLERLLRSHKQDTAIYQGDKDRATTMVQTGVKALGALVSALIPGGHAAVPKMLVAAATEGANLLIAKGIQGNDMGGNEIVRDGIGGIAKIGTAGITEGAIKPLTGVAGKAIAGDHESAAHAITGALTAAPQKALEATGAETGKAVAGEDTSKSLHNIQNRTLTGAAAGGLGDLVGKSDVLPDSLADAEFGVAPKMIADEKLQRELKKARG